MVKKKIHPCRRCRFDPGLGSSPAEGNGYPLQCSYLENSMDRERNLVGYNPWSHRVGRD